LSRVGASAEERLHDGGPGHPRTLQPPATPARAAILSLAPAKRSCYHAPMNERKSRGSDEGSSGWVTTDVAADALGVSSRSVRNYILNGDLVARKEKEGINERYVVSVDSLYALRDRRKQEGKLQRNFRENSRRPESSAENTTEVVRETAVDMLRETLASLETHIAQNAELRARLELTERAESTLREELESERLQRQEEVERERQERVEAQRRASFLERESSEAQKRAAQLSQEHTRLEQEHLRLEGEAERLREELESERSRGFWRRLFGG
jgi:hypothetical protein